MFDTFSSFFESTITEGSHAAAGLFGSGGGGGSGAGAEEASSSSSSSSPSLPHGGGGGGCGGSSSSRRRPVPLSQTGSSSGLRGSFEEAAERISSSVSSVLSSMEDLGIDSAEKCIGVNFQIQT